MSPADALVLFATMLGLAALPSTSVALVVTRSATAGLRHGIAVALGIVLGDLAFVAAALLGLAALAEVLGGLFSLVKLFGGLYLIWLGARMLFGRRAGSGQSARPPSASSLLRSVAAGLFLTLGDLKAILFYASLFPLFVDIHRLDLGDLILIILITVLSVGGVKLLYALAAHRVAARVRGARLRRVAEAGAGALLVGAGGYLITSLPR